MNSLGLRISRGGGSKSKKCIGFSPITIPALVFEQTAENNSEVQAFINATSTDDQLAILKKLLESNKDCLDDIVVKLLAVAFFQAEAKHPVKCFILRHITKNNQLQEPFTDALALQITAHMSSVPSDYKQYVGTVSKVITCTENFNAGMAAVRNVENTLAQYLKNCLECCVKTLSEQKTLSPTEKNEIFNLAHLTLRLLLHIVQKANSENISKIILNFKAIRLFIHELMEDDDVPMDTKSVGGILYLSMHVMENGEESWIEVLNSSSTNTSLNRLLELEAARLSLYSAIATVVAADQLFTKIVDDGPAILTLTNKIMDIGDRSSSESTFILGVARSLLQISKLMDKLQDRATGLTLVDSLLMFAWSHLEHYMDSVRHLTGQMLGCVVKYCTKLDQEGDKTALNKLSSALESLDRSRKSFYLSLAWLAGSLGARRLLRRLRLQDLLLALHDQPIHNTVSAALSSLLEQLCRECSASQLHAEWARAVLRHVRSRPLAPHVLAVLEALLARACALQPALIHYILPYIKEAAEPDSGPRDLRCVMMLVRVARQTRGAAQQERDTTQQERDTTQQTAGDAADWKGIISYQVLEEAAVDASDETRALSLSLVVESPRSTEEFCEGDLRFVLYYLRYNINAQSPNFRQLTLSLIKKFIKRLEESYKVIKRKKRPNGTDDKVAYYLKFVEELRRQCFDSLIPGGNYSRRFVALQVLVWCQQMNLEGYERSWEPCYVEKLLFHLEDSYESNKAFALDVLTDCPPLLLTSKKYSISLELDDIIKQASSLKPTDCVSAAYKLDLLQRKLPEHILQSEQCDADVAERARFCLTQRLLREIRGALAQLRRCVVRGAARAPTFGVLHCARRVLCALPAPAVAHDERWSALLADVIDASFAVTDAVAPVVNNSSPEGHLPMDMTLQITDYGNAGNVTLSDGRPVTAQMVLLCAWRCVKEVSLLLGALCARLSIREELEAAGEAAGGGSLCERQLRAVGAHFTSLLQHTQHRGAFEQAYVGFTLLLDRLWRCRAASLHALPARWLQALLAALQGAAAPATRRSAGLPYLVQALLSTELRLQARPRCLAGCLAALLRLAGGGGEARTHALNILRALFRASALHDSLAPYVGQALALALRGFDGHSWAERNSSTLLFSALVVRVFGVQRSRDAERLCARNKMTGRIFFLRYPHLYDFMLEKLQEASQNNDSQVMRPSLYPVLLLLSRLYPSSLEGTVSNLKLVAFIPHVVRCAHSGALQTRQLAARALVPLVAPHLYMSHIQWLLRVVSDEQIKRNYCHGILLQLWRLLEHPPPHLQLQASAADLQRQAPATELQPQASAADLQPQASVTELQAQASVTELQAQASVTELQAQASVTELQAQASVTDLQALVRGALWPLRRAAASAPPPCYLVLDELLKVINMLVWRFSPLPQEIAVEICSYLHTLIFDSEPPPISPGRDICLSNAMYLYLILTIKHHLADTTDLVYKGLQHSSYEVILSVLNYLLILHNETEEDTCRFREHLASIADRSYLNNMHNEKFIQLLRQVLKNQYLECQEKSLKILVLEGNTQRYIIETKNEEVTNDVIIQKLIDCIHEEHEKLTHIYLYSLLNFVTDLLQGCKLSVRVLLDVMRVVYECSSPENSDRCRSVVVGFIDTNIHQLLTCNMNELSEADRFEMRALFWATIITLLEDDEDSIRQRVGDALSPQGAAPARRAPAAAAHRLRGAPPHAWGGPTQEGALTQADGAALLAVLALLDFKSRVVLTDDVSEECRVFDQNERYNTFLEETVWTVAFADKITKEYNMNDAALCDHIDKPAYKGTFDRLCRDNVEVFKKMVAGVTVERNDALNPKIELFVKRLRNQLV